MVWGRSGQILKSSVCLLEEFELNSIGKKSEVLFFFFFFFYGTGV
jgi:hypothetical protein